MLANCIPGSQAKSEWSELSHFLIPATPTFHTILHGSVSADQSETQTASDWEDISFFLLFLLLYLIYLLSFFFLFAEKVILRHISDEAL